MLKPEIPRGTRDFPPDVVLKRKYIFKIIEEVFQLFGYKPLETPAMENLSTLTGKYGEENDRLIFKILNSGDYLAGIKENFAQIDIHNSEYWSAKLSPLLCEKALRFDLTVPFARYVAQYKNEINFPFKRYQIQPVWRADKPQKSRYREFYQCDVDVIGSKSLLYEFEMLQIIDEVFNRLKLTDLTIKLNNRKILMGIAEVVGELDRFSVLTTVIDKLEKIGIEGVNQELKERTIPQSTIEKLQKFLDFSGENSDKINFLKQQFVSSAIGLEGINEIEKIYEYINTIGLRSAKVEFDISLARGLDYYTATIFEAKVNNLPGGGVGSICGGGRYDNLTGIFGLPDVSGVGFSFGADRLYDVLLTLNLFPASIQTSTKILLVNFGKEEEKHSLQYISKLRAQGINAEIYPEAIKIKKQMEYANKNKIPYVLLAGSTEIAEGKYTFKNMETGEQKKLTLEEIIETLCRK